MHKAFQRQLEQALEQLEFPSTSTDHSLHPPPTNHSRKLLSTSPKQFTSTFLNANYSPKQYRSQSLGSTTESHHAQKSQQQNHDLDVTSSLNALDILHEKLKTYSQENRRLKIQLSEYHYLDQGKNKSCGEEQRSTTIVETNYGGKSKALDDENFLLRREKEELMERVEELERRMREMESSMVVSGKEQEFDSEEEDSSFEKLLDQEECKGDEDLSILMENEGVNEREQLERTSISIQCETTVETVDKETSTEETKLNLSETEDNQDIVIDISMLFEIAEIINKVEDSKPILKEIETISIEIQTEELSLTNDSEVLTTIHFSEQLEHLKKELEIKNDLISTLTKEKELFEKNEQEHQKVMTQLTLHIKDLVRESALLRLEYNESISKLKEELLASHNK